MKKFFGIFSAPRTSRFDWTPDVDLSYGSVRYTLGRAAYNG